MKKKSKQWKTSSKIAERSSKTENGKSILISGYIKCKGIELSIQTAKTGRINKVWATVCWLGETHVKCKDPKVDKMKNYNRRNSLLLFSFPTTSLHLSGNYDSWGETTQVPINWLMDTQTILYVYHRLLFIHK